MLTPTVTPGFIHTSLRHLISQSAPGPAESTHRMSHENVCRHAALQAAGILVPTRHRL